MNPRFPLPALVTIIAAVVSVGWAAPALGTEEVCGSGTFDVFLPGVAPLPSQTITLPKGCAIYALLVSGYQENRDLDRLTFFKLGRWILAKGGYVHWAWWNNLLQPYLAGSLHRAGENPHPGNLLGSSLIGFVVPEGVPKAVPEDDYQFQSDAKVFLSRIREENPTALIVVAGHSMGGNAVARLGADVTDVRIDLLAPIDPVGNRTSPVAPLLLSVPACANPDSQHTTFCQIYNWTRWRAAFRFRGFKQWDCIKEEGSCKDFDDRLLVVEYRCRAAGPWLTSYPLAPTKHLIACPRAFPVIDSGSRLVFRSNVRRLYHRWQKEALFPFDWTRDYRFSFAGTGVQRAVGENSATACASAGSTDCDRDKTCAEGFDPRLSSITCEGTDGHGEIIGYRGPGLPLALAAEVTNKPGWDENRRRALIELAERTREGSPWNFTPTAPDLDMVSDDMIGIVQELLDEKEVPCEADKQPPMTIATLSSEPNGAGWHNDDVVVSLAARDAPGGSGVKEITYQLWGATISSEPIVTAGDIVEITLSEEGLTTVRYKARDCQNEEVQQELVVRIDRTAPKLIANLSPPANRHDWNNTDVLVTFFAVDEPPLGAPSEWASGVGSVSDPVTLTGEGRMREAPGEATDRAGNLVTLVVNVNIDKTPPEIAGLPGPSCVLWPPDHRMVHVASVGATDSLSGLELDSFVVKGASSEPDSSPGAGRTAPDVRIQGGEIELRAERSGRSSARTYSLHAAVLDLASNLATAEASCVVPHDRRGRGRGRRSAE